MPVPCVQIQFSIDDAGRGDAIATDLLRHRLVACAQRVGPMTSRYWWNGSIDETAEWLFLCKTTADQLAAATERIRALHPYDVPEIIATEISAGHPPYLDWIAAQTSAAPGPTEHG